MAKNVVTRQTISDQLIELIRFSILNLEYPPGTRLIVDNLAERFNSSRTPVRDALKKLIEQGLVVYNGISYCVISLSSSDILEIFAIRSPLEKLAVKLTIEQNNAQAIKKIKEICTKHFQSTDANEMIELDIQFHKSIASASNSQRLETILLSLMDQTQLIHNWLFTKDSPLTLEKKTTNEHDKIINSIENGDVSEAIQAMEDHLTNAMERALSNSQLGV